MKNYVNKTIAAHDEIQLLRDKKLKEVSNSTFCTVYPFGM